MTTSLKGAVRNRRLVLHFDLNNTILMMDSAKGLGVVKNVQRVVTKSAWGVVISNESGENVWQLVHDQLTFSAPECPSNMPI